jgi:hypothetical protein
LVVTLQAIPSASHSANDLIQTHAVWQCWVEQDQRVFPGTLTILERRGADFRGEMKLDFGNHRWGQYTFHGEMNDGHMAFLTDRKAGAVTFPGLYVGKVKGRSIIGTWRVPTYTRHGEDWHNCRSC